MKLKTNKFKIDKAAEIHINNMVQSLPTLPLYNKAGQPVYRNTQVPGTYLIEHGVHKDTKGNDIQPNVLYMSPILQYTDHRKNLILAYQASGMKGLEVYEKEVLAIQHEKEAEMKALTPWWKRFLRSLMFWKGV